MPSAAASRTRRAAGDELLELIALHDASQHRRR
jgi:hypothetical protein